MAYQRKTQDYFEIQGFYGSQYGWEVVTSEETYKDAKTQIQCYRANEPNTSFRIKKRREQKPEGQK
jgi:hypothetical protein